MSYDSAPEAVFKVQAEFEGYEARCVNSNFLKGVEWSPDGACLLTASDDNRLRVFDLSADVLEASGLGNADENSLDGIASAVDSSPPAITIQEGELVYDYAWYKGMTAADPSTCCFATTCRALPIHLWDACTGELRCSYRAFDDKDEVSASNSITFSPDGATLAAGASKVIRLFQTAVPGRSCRMRRTHSKKDSGQPGIISCLAFSPDTEGLLAAGSYSGVAALYDGRTLAPAAVMSGGHSTGITQVTWSPDGNFLYSGARQHPNILCWDVRNTGEVLYALDRQAGCTNQRLQFSIEPLGRHMAAGDTEGKMHVFDLAAGSEKSQFSTCHDTVNGCQYHPYLPLIAMSSGQRRFTVDDSDSSGDDSNSIRDAIRPPSTSVSQQLEIGSRLHNTLLIWRLDCSWSETQSPVDVQVDAQVEANDLCQ